MSNSEEQQYVRPEQQTASASQRTSTSTSTHNGTKVRSSSSSTSSSSSLSSSASSSCAESGDENRGGAISSSKNKKATKKSDDLHHDGNGGSIVSSLMFFVALMSVSIFLGGLGAMAFQKLLANEKNEITIPPTGGENNASSPSTWGEAGNSISEKKNVDSKHSSLSTGDSQQTVPTAQQDKSQISGVVNQKVKKVAGRGMLAAGVGTVVGAAGAVGVGLLQSQGSIDSSKDCECDGCPINTSTETKTVDTATNAAMDCENGECPITSTETKTAADAMDCENGECPITSTETKTADAMDCEGGECLSPETKIADTVINGAIDSSNCKDCKCDTRLIEEADSSFLTSELTNVAFIAFIALLVASLMLLLVSAVGYCSASSDSDHDDCDHDDCGDEDSPV